jgi:regulator of RNase E activity RraA
MTDIKEEMLAALRTVSTATLTMQLLKRGMRSCFISGARPLATGTPRIAAEAYTLRFVPFREDLSVPEVLGDPEYPPRKAVEDIPPGQIMVIDCRGEQSAGTIGDILALRMKIRGAVGIVTDGPVRDGAAVAETGLPVFCSGTVAPASIWTHFGADLQCPVACGGATVFPGDVIVADDDGAVVIPRKLVAEISKSAPEQEQLEEFLKTRIADGHMTFGTYPPNEETLAAYADWRKKNEEL